MLTYQNVEDILVRCFLQAWGDTTPVILKNQKQTQIPKGAEAWVRFTVLRTASAQDSLGEVGNRRFLRMGRVFVQIFVRTGTKTGRLNELSSKVMDLYENTTFPNFRVLQITQQDLADGADVSNSKSGDGVWFGTLINVQFTFDEIK